MPQSPSPSSLEQVRQALRRAYYLGQTYWQQADSESPKQHAKADETRAKFEALVEETCAALSALEALGQQAEPVAWRRQIWNSAVESCALVVEPVPHVDEERTCREVATEIRKLKMEGGCIAALQQQEAGSLSDEQIVEIRDQHLPSQGEPFDCLAFARAVLAAAAPSPTEPKAADGGASGYDGVTTHPEFGRNAGAKEDGNG